MLKRLKCLMSAHRTYRERRELAGVPVLHWVCENCGHAWPIVTRSEDGYRDAAQSGLRPLRAKTITAPSAAERARAMEAIRAQA